MKKIIALLMMCTLCFSLITNFNVASYANDLYIKLFEPVILLSSLNIFAYVIF